MSKQQRSRRRNALRPPRSCPWDHNEAVRLWIRNGHRHPLGSRPNPPAGFRREWMATMTGLIRARRIAEQSRIARARGTSLQRGAGILFELFDEPYRLTPTHGGL